MITKQQAIEVHDAIPTSDAVALRALIDALADAQAFPDADALAEIESVAREIEAWEDCDDEGPSWNDVCEASLRLATACRKLVRP